MDDLQVFDSMTPVMNKRLTFSKLPCEEQVLDALSGCVDIMDILHLTMNTTYHVFGVPVELITVTVLLMNLVALLDRRGPFYRKVPLVRDINSTNRIKRGKSGLWHK